MFRQRFFQRFLLTPQKIKILCKTEYVFLEINLPILRYIYFLNQDEDINYLLARLCKSVG